MKKLLKRLLIALLLIVGIGAALAYVGYRRFRSAPDWYQRPALTPAEAEAAAKSVEDKVSRDVQNQVARLRAAAARDRASDQPPATRPAAEREITASFTEDELNAFWQKWSDDAGWSAEADKFVSNPVVRLADGRLILAGTVKELGTVVSLQFAPHPSKAGGITLQLDGVRGGRLPLPVSVVASQKAALTRVLSRDLPSLARRASFAPDGAANDAAINATLAEELVNLLAVRPVQPILFLPVTNLGAAPDFLPARVVGLKIADRKIDLTARLLTAAERAALLEKLRDDKPVAVAEQ